MIVWVDDYFSEEGVIGGAELTSAAIMKHSGVPILTLKSDSLNSATIQGLKDRYWIFGNCAQLPLDIILECTKTLNYSVIEYDYKFCKYRLKEKHIVAEGQCLCEDSLLGKTIAVFFAKADYLWFMSEKQKNIYLKYYPFLDQETTRILSSVLDTYTIDIISSLRGTKKNNKWLINDSQVWVKGTEQALKYAKDNNLDFETFSNLSHQELLNKFATAKGFIFLPNGSDTCPRTVIEAKLSNCELIVNENVQHMGEEWFQQNIPNIEEYLRCRATVFWDMVGSLSSNRLPPPRTYSKSQTHFKIIIPAYNSENWIIKTLESVANQEYNNYKCYIVDDISSDTTYKSAENYLNNLNDNRFTLIKNTEKKFALKNIYDLINISDPDKEDIIVVLDGDDWLSNNHVLSQLDYYYKKEGCLVTYGSFVQYPDGIIGEESSRYPTSVIKNNTYRQDKWRASHLKTFSYSAWSKVKTEDLQNKNGNFYEVSYDQAMMLPLLEMCGEKVKYISEVLCVYNVSNPQAVNKTRETNQYKNMLEIREKCPYERL